MTRILLNSTDNITLVGGGPVDRSALDLAVARAPVLVAADAGADRIEAAGMRPVALIGDMDSVNKIENWQNSDVGIFKIEDQDTTDFEKCLHGVVAPLILGVGFLGGRVDHALAALNALVRYRASPVLLLGQEDVIFACPTRLDLDLAPGTRVSFFPMASVTGVHSVGLHWPITGLAFAPDGKIGTSNQATGPVEAAFDAPGMLVSLPLDCLDLAIAALSTPLSIPAR